ncbi:MAG: BadF/BadG/BcrA/BcrD ATPase family protein [Cyanobacteriota bacterium]|nr:BadF/BadG/BcrA/BcrD ATPase family protein [Cyanobacteriota bacterium]
MTDRSSPAGGPPEPRALLAGFDAGQTHTTCRLAAASGRVLVEGKGPGVGHLDAPEGEQRFQEALRESLVRARARLVDQQRPEGLWPLEAAAIGASGIEHGSAVQERGQRLAMATLGLPAARLLVTGDERTALAGALPRGEGILVISGTGTIALGRDRDGRHHRCAGWGWLLDGAGSAMDIGRDALSLSLRMADGRLPEGPLRQALWQALGLALEDPESPQRIKARVVAPDFAPAGFAALAPVVDRQAAAGDALALELLRRHGEALVEMVVAIAAHLELPAPPVCTLGGAITHLAGLRDAFGPALDRALPGARWQEPVGDGCAGALGLAAGLVAQWPPEPG